ncbi:MAG: efflux RND transporter permease subunit [Egibacteraceae bacterium]
MRFRRLIIALAAGLMVVGITQLGATPVDLLPEFARTRVEVQTEALGLSAEEVEQLITVPLEQDLLNGVAFLDEIESASLPGLSSIVLTFEPGTSLLDARQVVAERLTQAVGVAGLPEVAEPPQMLQPLSSTSRVLMVKLSSEELSPIEMSLLARWVIVPRLVGVDGVANVAIWGFRDRQLQVQVDPARLAAADVSLEQVIRTAGNALEVSPLSFLEASSPGTGGFIDTVNQRLHVFHEQTISTPEELAQVPVEGPEGGAALVDGRPLALGEVAQIVEDHQPLIGDALCSDGPCTLLVVEKFPEANTPAVTRGVDAALNALLPGLDGMRIGTYTYRPAAFIEASFDNLGRALSIGGILALLLLTAFFFEWRAALISAVVIPMSLVVAGLVLYFSGVTVHTMTLAGLAMALVVIVDDAVVDLDHMGRRLRERRTSGAGTQGWRTIVEGLLEMRQGILYATLIVAAALIPFFFLPGDAGAFLPPIAVAYLLAIAASTLVALTLTPALAVMLLAGKQPARRESPLVRMGQRGYDKVARIVPRTGFALLAFGVVVAIGLATVGFLDQRLRPTLRERDVLVEMQAPPGTSLPRMDEITAQAVGELRSLAGVAAVGAHVGRAVSSDQIVNVNSAELWVNLEPSADYDATVAAIERVVGGHREVSSNVLTYSEQRIGDVLQRQDDEVLVRIYGQDREILERKALEVQAVLAGVEGVEDPRVELVADEPTIEVEVDIARAQAFGVKPGDIRREAATLLGGIVVGNLFEEQKVFDVVVWGAPELRQSEDQVRGLPIETPGGVVRLDQVADVRLAPNASVIRHESVTRYIDVSAGVAGRPVDEVLGEVGSALEQVEFPFEHHAELLGGYAEQQAARTRVLSVALAAAIGILLLLQAAFASWRLAALFFVVLPMALVGGLVATLADGGEVTLGSVVGLVAVLGLAASNGVVLIRTYQRLERHEGQSFGFPLVERGTRERLGPILATALALALLLAPVVIAGDASGFEIVRPLAVAVMGGLVTSTVLSLVVVPAAYLWYGRRFQDADAWREDEELRAIHAGTLSSLGGPQQELGNRASTLSTRRGPQ